jgi:hypothetical protein
VVEYSYDALDRLSGRKVDGEPEQISYDALSRPVAIENPLGAFSLQYDGATTHLVGLDSAGSPKLVARYGPADAGPGCRRSTSMVTTANRWLASDIATTCWVG